MKDFRIPVHPEGWPFIAGALGISALLSLLWSPLGFLGLIISAWCIYFFRDPDRFTPLRPGLIVSPADGIVAKIEQAPLPKELEIGDEMRTRVSIYLNVFDVHVTRMPASGVVKKIFYFPGLFLRASLDKASELNERYATSLELQDGSDLVVVQIAGLIARRIKNELAPDMSVERGARFGIIRFGSRVDLYLPKGMEPLVLQGQRMIGGETVIAGS